MPRRRRAGGVLLRRLGTRPRARHWSAMPKSSRKPFKRGDHVSWNSEAGRVRGHILRVHTEDVDYKGYVHHATPEDPQYEIKSDKTDHVALHKGRALRRL